MNETLIFHFYVLHNRNELDAALVRYVHLDGSPASDTATFQVSLLLDGMDGTATSRSQNQVTAKQAMQQAVTAKTHGASSSKEDDSTTFVIVRVVFVEFSVEFSRLEAVPVSRDNNYGAFITSHVRTINYFYTIIPYKTLLYFMAWSNANERVLQKNNTKRKM